MEVSGGLPSLVDLGFHGAFGLVAAAVLAWLSCWVLNESEGVGKIEKFLRVYIQVSGIWDGFLV